MEKVKEIELLQSLKGDTYFAQLFDDSQIDAMCENIRNDYPIEFGLSLFSKETAALKEKLDDYKKQAKYVAKELLVAADNYTDSSFEDLAARLIGHNKCIIVKLQQGLPLTQEECDTVIKLIKNESN